MTKHSCLSDMQPDSMTVRLVEQRIFELFRRALRSYGFAELRDQTLPRHECDIQLNIIGKLTVVFTQT